MIDIAGQAKTLKSYNWDTQQFSNPMHSQTISDIHISSLVKSSHVPSQQRAPHSLGIYTSRKIDEATRRPSPFGLVPSIVRPNKSLVFEYGGKNHTLANTTDYNLKRDQRY